MVLHHGGKLLEAVKQYGIPKEDWLDLSTGINPYAYPVSDIPPDIWQRLPEENDGLEDAVANYYGKPISGQDFLVTPGSQWAIQQLPLLRQKLFGGGKVLLPKLGYQEHQYAWRKNGFDCDYYLEEPSQEQLENCDVCVVINPNNPAGWFADKEQLIAWQKKLQLKDAWLIVDEAFIDSLKNISGRSEGKSLLSILVGDNVIVLRSIGKFFGLAGIRSGVLFSSHLIVNELKNELGPWAVTGPSRWAAKQALLDLAWQEAMRDKLSKMAKKLSQLLEANLNTSTAGSSLFKTVFIKDAEAVHKALCHKGILVRLLDDKSGLRFGLPQDTARNWTRLDMALASISDTCKESLDHN